MAAQVHRKRVAATSRSRHLAIRRKPAAAAVPLSKKKAKKSEGPIPASLPTASPSPPSPAPVPPATPVPPVPGPSAAKKGDRLLQTFGGHYINQLWTKGPQENYLKLFYLENARLSFAISCCFFLSLCIYWGARDFGYISDCGRWFHARRPKTSID